MVRGKYVYGEKEKGGGSRNDRERIKAQNWDLSYIFLTLSLNAPYYHPQKEEFIFYLFCFIWVLSLIFIYSFVPPVAPERGAVKCITLTVLT